MEDPILGEPLAALLSQPATTTMLPLMNMVSQKQPWTLFFPHFIYQILKLKIPDNQKIEVHPKDNYVLGGKWQVWPDNQNMGIWKNFIKLSNYVNKLWLVLILQSVL